VRSQRSGRNDDQGQLKPQTPQTFEKEHTIMLKREDWLKRWCKWHPGTNQAQVEQQFAVWEKLNSRCEVLETIAEQHASHSSLRLDNARREIELAKKRLDFGVPYRVIVLGESGAGKSTFVNALTGRDLLPTAPGGAITGVATYVVMGKENEPEKVEVVYRSDEQFNHLLQRMAKRFGLNVADSPEAILQDLKQPGQKVFKQHVQEPHRSVLLHDLDDIARTWILLKVQGMMGKKILFDLIRDRGRIKSLIGEDEGENKIPNNDRALSRTAHSTCYALQSIIHDRRPNVS
jgi:energy-coupling factor transporter ATP-binding protein EcfA2